MTRAAPVAGGTATGPVASLGRGGPRFTSIKHIAVLRGGGLGDLLFAMPALESLAAAYPDASITLLGTSAHGELLIGRESPVRTVMTLPAVTGVHGGAPNGDAAERFVARARAERFDLAVQLHGGGRYSNPFLTRLRARHTIGSRTEDAEPLERCVPYTYYQHEVLRGLEVVSLAGAPPVTLEPALQPTSAERAAAAHWRDPAARGIVVVHPGATDPRRRWPVERFGGVAARLARDGYRVIVVGDEGERVLARGVVDAACACDPSVRPRVGSVAGRLRLTALIGLLDAADLVVANDSGPRHLAQAVGSATVGVFWVGNVINAAPLSRARQRVQLSWTTRCPVCGRDCTQVGWTSERCEHDVSFVADVPEEPVYEDAAGLLAAGERE